MNEKIEKTGWRPRLVILDFDGTIGDTNNVIVSTMQATLRELGLPMQTPKACSSTIGLPLGKGLRHFFPWMRRWSSDVLILTGASSQ